MAPPSATPWTSLPLVDVVAFVVVVVERAPESSVLDEASLRAEEVAPARSVASALSSSVLESPVASTFDPFSSAKVKEIDVRPSWTVCCNTPRPGDAFRIEGEEVLARSSSRSSPAEACTSAMQVITLEEEAAEEPEEAMTRSENVVMPEGTATGLLQEAELNLDPESVSAFADVLLSKTSSSSSGTGGGSS